MESYLKKFVLNGNDDFGIENYYQIYFTKHYCEDRKKIKKKTGNSFTLNRKVDGVDLDVFDSILKYGDFKSTQIFNHLYDNKIGKYIIQIYLDKEMDKKAYFLIASEKHKLKKYEILEYISQEELNSMEKFPTISRHSFSLISATVNNDNYVQYTNVPIANRLNVENITLEEIFEKRDKVKQMLANIKKRRELNTCEEC